MARIKASDKRKVYTGIDTFITAIPLTPEDTFKFDCIRCGWCCSYTPALNPKESHTIAKYLGMSNGEFFNKHVTLVENINCGYIAALDKIGDKCAFYAKENGKSSCKIQEVKPNLCLEKPVLRLEGRRPQGMESLKLFFEPCRGMGRGKEQSVREWIEKNDLMTYWSDDFEYYSKLAEMARTMPAAEVERKVREMFCQG
jgi:Fe-S-cluster containining protein